MSAVWWIAAAVLGGLGAVLRVWATQAGEQRLPGGAPTATGIVNVVGAAAIGAVYAIGGDPLQLVLAAGLLGGFTTFSTWMVEVDEAQRTGRVRSATLILLLPLIVGVAACAITRAAV